MFQIRSSWEKIRGAAAAVIISFLFCLCGSFFIFYLAPSQAIATFRISRLPVMDVNYVQSLETGDRIVVTGALKDNPALLQGNNLVAYTKETWHVDPPNPDSENDQAKGNWELTETRLPELKLDISGEELETLTTASVRISGSTQIIIRAGTGDQVAEFEGEPLPDGSMRFIGFLNGDLVTVYGSKASNGAVLPEEIFGGDRIEFENSQQDAAKGFLIGGLTVLACAPVILIGGLIAALRRRRKRGLRRFFG